MKNARSFKRRIAHGPVCLGTCIGFTDPTVTESLCGLLDFVWIDMEHNALTLETVQGHIMATKGSETVPLVRAALEDPVLIKPVLDIGAAGIIVPLVGHRPTRHAGGSGFSLSAGRSSRLRPRRPSNYGRLRGPEFCREADESMIVIVKSSTSTRSAIWTRFSPSLV